MWALTFLFILPTFVPISLFVSVKEIVSLMFKLNWFRHHNLTDGVCRYNWVTYLQEDCWIEISTSTRSFSGEFLEPSAENESVWRFSDTSPTHWHPPTVSIHHPLFGIEITYKSFQIFTSIFKKVFALSESRITRQVHSAVPCNIASHNGCCLSGICTIAATFACDWLSWLTWVPVDQSQADVATKVHAPLKHIILCSVAIGTSKNKNLPTPYKDSGFLKVSHVTIEELYDQNFCALHQSLLLEIIIICSPFSRSDRCSPKHYSLLPSKVCSVLIQDLSPDFEFQFHNKVIMLDIL